MNEVSNEVEVNTQGEGLQDSDPKGSNNWEEMARKAQSKADKYEHITKKFGENLEQELEAFSEFKNSYQRDPKGTLQFLQEQAGIQINEPQPPANATQEELNIWELGNKDSQAYKWLENQIATISDKKAQEKAEAALTKYKQEQQLNQWRTELANNGITDYKAQNDAIREFLNPNPDFNEFLQSKVSKGNQQQMRPSDVMRQVQQNQSQPKSTGVLQGGGMPPRPSAEEESVANVMSIAKAKSGLETF